MALGVFIAPAATAAEIGVASTFYDRVIACPPYRIDPYRVLGAAHKTLPCGTMVEVTNRNNGRKVIVRIVDLGPCTTPHCQATAPARVKKRIFDLLPMAARAIGSDGLAMVSLVVK